MVFAPAYWIEIRMGIWRSSSSTSRCTRTTFASVSAVPKYRVHWETC